MKFSRRVWKISCIEGAHHMAYAEMDGWVAEIKGILAAASPRLGA